MVNSWNSWNLRCFSFARHMLWAYFVPPHGCICLRCQMLNQFSRMAIGRGNNILTLCQPMHSGSSRMRELPACVFTFSEKKKKKLHVMLQSGTPLCFNNLPASLGQEVEASSSHNPSKLTSEKGVTAVLIHCLVTLSNIPGAILHPWKNKYNCALPYINFLFVNFSTCRELNCWIISIIRVMTEHFDWTAGIPWMLIHRQGPLTHCFDNFFTQNPTQGVE